MGFYEELEARGLIQQVTSPLLRDALNHTQVTAYLGFDPTADSLHIGHLLGLVTLKRFRQAGHRLIALVGGATGMIGDPSGKTQERQLLSAEQMGKNVKSIHQMISKLLQTSDQDADIELVNNLDWTDSLSTIDFLRDIGKHFTVNSMLGKDSVQGRLEDREHGLSYTEFSYMILQAYDYYILNQRYGCQLQLGGSDQWGNITAGIELIRRKSTKNSQTSTALGLTWPLVTKADGTKFGKTESGAIWLSAEKTSPYDFYQFLIRTPDADVIRYLKFFSFLSLEEILELEESSRTHPEKRLAQKALADEVTRLVHGPERLAEVQQGSEALFQGKLADLDAQSLQTWALGLPSTKKAQSSFLTGLDLVELLVETRLVSSKGQARQEIQSGGIYLNDERITDPTTRLLLKHVLHGRYLLLRKGKKNYHVIECINESPPATS